MRKSKSTFDIMKIGKTLNKGEILYRIIYAIIFSISFCLFIWQVYSLVKAYLQYKTSISLEIRGTEKSEFPVFTICPEYLGYNMDFLSKYNSTPNSIRKLNFPKNINMSAMDFFKLSTYDVEEIISQMVIKVSEVYENKTESFCRNISNDGYYIYMPIFTTLWKVQTYLNFGRCFSYKIPQSIQRKKVKLKIEIVFEELFLHLHTYLSIQNFLD